MKIELKEESWKNLLENIRKENMSTTGNFWAAIQSIEYQLEKKSDQHISKQRLRDAIKFLRPTRHGFKDLEVVEDCLDDLEKELGL